MSLVHIGARARGDGSALSLLLECHARIRSSIDLAARLGAAMHVGEDEREAAERLYRYFAIALPLHVADEEESLRPRLERIEELRRPLEVMSAEHDAIEDTLAELKDAWRAIADGKSIAPSTTDRAVMFLAAHMSEHLYAEETIIFPALARLTPAALDEIAAEIARRRRS